MRNIGLGELNVAGEGQTAAARKTYSNMGIFGMFESLRCCLKISSRQQLLGDKCPHGSYAYDAKEIHFGNIYCMRFVCFSFVILLSYFGIVASSCFCFLSTFYMVYYNNSWSFLQSACHVVCLFVCLLLGGGSVYHSQVLLVHL